MAPPDLLQKEPTLPTPASRTVRQYIPVVLVTMSPALGDGSCEKPILRPWTAMQPLAMTCRKGYLATQGRASEGSSVVQRETPQPSSSEPGLHVCADKKVHRSAVWDSASLETTKCLAQDTRGPTL